MGRTAILRLPDKVLAADSVFQIESGRWCIDTSKNGIASRRLERDHAFAIRQNRRRSQKKQFLAETVLLPEESTRKGALTPGIWGPHRRVVFRGG